MSHIRTYQFMASCICDAMCLVMLLLHFPIASSLFRSIISEHTSSMPLLLFNAPRCRRLGGIIGSTTVASSLLLLDELTCRQCSMRRTRGIIVHQQACRYSNEHISRPRDLEAAPCMTVEQAPNFCLRPFASRAASSSLTRAAYIGFDLQSRAFRSSAHTSSMAPPAVPPPPSRCVMIDVCEGTAAGGTAGDTGLLNVANDRWESMRSSLAMTAHAAQPLPKPPRDSSAPFLLHQSLSVRAIGAMSQPGALRYTCS